MSCVSCTHNKTAYANCQPVLRARRIIPLSFMRTRMLSRVSRTKGSEFSQNRLCKILRVTPNERPPAAGPFIRSFGNADGISYVNKASLVSYPLMTFSTSDVLSLRQQHTNRSTTSQHATESRHLAS